MRARRTTSRVHSEVTLGLPSRSPPIHEPKVTMDLVSGSRGHPCAKREVSTRRIKVGIPSQMVC